MRGSKDYACAQAARKGGGEALVTQLCAKGTVPEGVIRLVDPPGAVACMMVQRRP